MRIADYNVCNNCLHRIDKNNRIIITKTKPTKCEYCHKRPKQTKIANPADSYRYARPDSQDIEVCTYAEGGPECGAIDCKENHR